MSSTEDDKLLKYNMNNKKILEITFVGCVCGVILCIFCVPIIVYATSDDITPITELLNDTLNVEIDNCTQQVSKS